MNVLITAAHPDDEVLGVGGTVAKLAQQGERVAVCFLTDGSFARNCDVALHMECAKKACRELGVSRTYFLGFQDQKLDVYPILDINKKLEEVVKEVEPVVVYTHHYGDLNLDHRIACEATLVATRPASSPVKKVLCFETLSSTEWGAPGQFPFTPNVYENIEKTFEKKKRALYHYRETSANEVKEFPHPRSEEAMIALAKLRGSVVGCKMAEAFLLIRERID